MRYFFLWSLKNKGWDMNGTGKDNCLHSFFINRLFTKILKQMVDNCPNVRPQSSGATGAKSNWDPQPVVLMAIMTVVIFHVTRTEPIVAGCFIFWLQINADRLLLIKRTDMQLKPIFGLFVKSLLQLTIHSLLASVVSLMFVLTGRWPDP